MAIRHFGIYRNVSTEEAKLDKLVLKALFRRGSKAEYELANKVIAKPGQPQRIGDEAWQACMARLAEWGMVKFQTPSWTKSRIVGLTALGCEWAEELCCAEQTEQVEQAEAARERQNRARNGF